MKVKEVVPEIKKKDMTSIMLKVFEQYQLCRVAQKDESRRKYCEAIEEAVSRLIGREKTIIEERFMKESGVFDYVVYNHKIEPPMSKDTYTKWRDRAFQKLYLAFCEEGIIQES